MRANIWIVYSTRFVRKLEDFCNTNKWKYEGLKDDDISTMMFQRSLIIITTGQKTEKLQKKKKKYAQGKSKPKQTQNTTSRLETKMLDSVWIRTKPKQNKINLLKNLQTAILSQEELNSWSLSPKQQHTQEKYWWCKKELFAMLRNSEYKWNPKSP